MYFFSNSYKWNWTFHAMHIFFSLQSIPDTLLALWNGKSDAGIFDDVAILPGNLHYTVLNPKNPSNYGLVHNNGSQRFCEEPETVIHFVTAYSFCIDIVPLDNFGCALRKDRLNSLLKNFWESRLLCLKIPCT